MNLKCYVSDVTASDVTSLKDDQLLAAASSVNSILSDVHTDGSGSVNTTLNSKHSGGKVVSPRPHTVTSLAEVVSASAQQDNMQVSLLSQSNLLPSEFYNSSTYLARFSVKERHYLY